MNYLDIFPDETEIPTRIALAAGVLVAVEALEVGKMEDAAQFLYLVAQGAFSEDTYAEAVILLQRLDLANVLEDAVDDEE